MPLDNKITFTGALGDALAARLDMPPGRPRAFALFAHCFTRSKDIFAAARVSAGLAERGIAVLRFDFTGLGHSDGEFANTNFASNVGDLVAAANWLAEYHAAPGLLIGHSLGGAAVLARPAPSPASRPSPPSARRSIPNMSRKTSPMRSRKSASAAPPRSALAGARSSLKSNSSTTSPGKTKKRRSNI